jgi:soluble lytic murein transglycosylase-like protein
LASASSEIQKVEDSLCSISTTYPQSIRQWCEFIDRFASEHGIPADLIAAVMLQESNGDPLAYSKSGAVGLLQVMPRDGLASGFMCINGPCFASRPTIIELQDPEFNISYGASMLANLIQHYGGIRDGLLHYGPENVGYYYADKVLAIYQNYQE